MYPYTEYLPPYLQGVQEIKTLGASIDPPAVQSQERLVQIWYNQFVTACDEETLRRRERLFGILADSLREDIEFRRERLLLRYRTRLPLTMNFLRQRLDEIIGQDQYKAWVSYGDWYYRLGSWKLGEQSFQDEPYVLHIEAVTENPSWYTEVQTFVSKIKPANIVFSFTPTLRGGAMISETIGIYPRIWNYRLGKWKMGIPPFRSVGYSGGGAWYYQLGKWKLSSTPFADNSTIEVKKVPQASSLKPELLNQFAQLTARSIVAVRINGDLTIHDLQKRVTMDTTTIRYTVSALMGLREITHVELLDESGTVLSGCAIYIPVPATDQIVVKHIIPHKEATV